MTGNAIAIVDNLLDILNQAGLPPPAGADQQAPANYLEGAESTTVGNTVQVTTDLKRLTQCWIDSELGPNDELDVYLGCIGKVMEIEDDDETLQLRWGNMDTVWIPARACQDAGGAGETLPGSSVSWLSGEAKESEEFLLFQTIQQVQSGSTVRVTTEMSVLETQWQASELGPNDELDGYLGAVGKVMEIEDDDDTLQVRWLNMDTCWMPALACGDAHGAEETMPGSQVSWLASQQDDGKEAAPVILKPDGPLLQSVNDVSLGARVCVTGSHDVLTAAWAEAELGPNDELEMYLGCVGEVRELEEDDDTLQIRWGNMDTCWMPVMACYVTTDELSIPAKSADWIA